MKCIPRPKSRMLYLDLLLINIDDTRIFTTWTTHCLVGKYLANLLNSLTINEYSVKDSFDAASRIKGISQHLFDNGYQYISFDIESLFTNVPIKRTVDLILKEYIQIN